MQWIQPQSHKEGDNIRAIPAWKALNGGFTHIVSWKECEENKEREVKKTQ